MLSGHCMSLWVGGRGYIWLRYDWILLCEEDVAELRLGSRSLAQFFLGNKDLPLAPLLPLLWELAGVPTGLSGFHLGTGPCLLPDCSLEASRPAIFQA